VRQSRENRSRVEFTASYGESPTRVSLTCEYSRDKGALILCQN